MVKFTIPKRVIPKRVQDVIVGIAIFLAIGFFPAALAGKPQAAKVSFIMAACAVIPYGMRSRTLRQGLLRGLGLGLTAGVGLIAALFNIAAKGQAQGGAPRMILTDQAIITLMLGMAAMCMIVCGVFALAARKRHQEAKRQWDEHNRE